MFVSSLDWEIYVMGSDGSNVRNLSNNAELDFDPIWSPDGTQIAFVSDRDGNFEIYVMNVDGSNLQRLTDDPACDLIGRTALGACQP